MKDCQRGTGFLDNVDRSSISMKAHRVLITKAHALKACPEIRHRLRLIGADEMKIPNPGKSAGPLKDFIFVQLLGYPENGAKHQLWHVTMNYGLGRL